MERGVLCVWGAQEEGGGGHFADSKSYTVTPELPLRQASPGAGQEAGAGPWLSGVCAGPGAQLVGDVW